MRYPDGKEVELLADYLAWKFDSDYVTEDEDVMCGMRDFFYRCLYNFYYFKEWMDFEEFFKDSKVEDYII